MTTGFECTFTNVFYTVREPQSLKFIATKKRFTTNYFKRCGKYNLSYIFTSFKRILPNGNNTFRNSDNTFSINNAFAEHLTVF